MLVLLYVLELTVGFESNLNNNAVRKKEKYVNLINEMSRNYRCVRFVNLSMSSLGVFSDECSTFLDMMYDIGIDKELDSCSRVSCQKATLLLSKNT